MKKAYIIAVILSFALLGLSSLAVNAANTIVPSSSGYTMTIQYANDSDVPRHMNITAGIYRFQFDVAQSQAQWYNSANGAIGGGSQNPLHTNASVSGSTITYTNAFSGVNLSYVFANNMLKETLSIGSVPNNVSTADFFRYKINVFYNSSLKVCVNGTCYTNPSGVNVNTTNDITFLDASNNTVFTIPKANVTDASGTTMNATFFLSLNNGVDLWYLGIPAQMVKTGTYPLLLDPTIIVTGGDGASGGTDFVTRTINATQIIAFTGGSGSTTPSAYYSYDGGKTFGTAVTGSNIGNPFHCENVGDNIVVCIGSSTSQNFNLTSKTWSTTAGTVVTSANSCSRPYRLRNGDVAVYCSAGGANTEIWTSSNLGATSWIQRTATSGNYDVSSDGEKSLTQTPDGFVWVIKSGGAQGDVLLNYSNVTWADPPVTYVLSRSDSYHSVISSANGTIYAVDGNQTVFTYLKISDTTKAVITFQNITQPFNVTLQANEASTLVQDVNTKNIYMSFNNFSQDVRGKLWVYNATNDGMSWNFATPQYISPVFAAFRSWLGGRGNAQSNTNYAGYQLNSSLNSTLDIIMFNGTGSVGLAYDNMTIVGAAAPPNAITVTIQSPTNTSYNFLNITLNFTVTNNTAIDKCYYTLNGGGITTITSCANTTILAQNGANNLTVTVNATDGVTNGTATVNFTADTLKPSGFIQSPTNTSYNFLNITFNFTTQDNLGSVTCIRELNGVNATVTGCLNTTILATNGANILKLYTLDTVNNTNVTSVNFTADNITPTVTITSPANITYNTLTISRTFNAGDNLGSITCIQELNGVNTTLASCANGTITAIQNGNRIKIYVLDTLNNSANAQVNFSADTIFPTVSITSPANTTLTTTNITLSYNRNDTNLDSCMRNLNGVNASIPGCVNTTILGVQGANTIIVFVNDTAGNVNSSTVHFTVDSVAPTVTIISPTNTTYISNHTIPLTYTVSDVSPPITCRYNLDGTGLNLITNCNNITLNFTVVGAHFVVLNATDNFGNSVAVQTNFTIVNNAPSLTRLSPVNTTYYALNAKVDINFTVSDIDLDSCWYVLDSNPLVLLSGCNNTNITGLAIGQHQLTIFANDSWNAQNSSGVNFTMFQGINVSVALPNGTLLNNFNVVSRNSTTTVIVSSQNSPALIAYNQLAQGTDVNITVTKSGFDNESFLFGINSTMDLPQHTFTIYPMTNVTFGAIGYGTFSNWMLTVFNSTNVLYINATVPTTYVTSNRFLYSGNNNFFGDGVNDFYQGNLTANINLNIGYNLQINTTPILAQLWAQDEITGIKKWSNIQFTLVSSNVTAALVTIIRRGNTCLWDGDNSTNCVGLTDSSPPSTATGFQEQLGQDFNNATYKLTYSYLAPVTHCGTGTINVYAVKQDGTLVNYFTDTIINPSNLYTNTVTFTVDNMNSTYPRAITFWLNLTTARCGIDFNTIAIQEFTQVNNSAGYNYVDDYTVSIPTVLLTNYQTVIGQFTGEKLYQTEYTTIRNYYYSLSRVSSTNLVGYLLRDVGDNGYYQYFTVLDGNNQPISGATMTFGRWYGGIENTVAQCRTSASGTCQVWIQSNQPLYSLRVTASGYQTYYNQSTTYVSGQGMAYIYLSTGQTAVLQNPFNGITSTITPDQAYFNNATNMTCTVTASDGNLNFVLFNVTRVTAFGNATNYASLFTNSNPSGTALTIPIVDNGQFQFNCLYNFVSNATGSTVTYQTSNTKTIWVYSDTLANAANTSGLDPLLALVIALGIIIIVCAPIALVSPTYGLVIAIFLLLIFAWVGMIPTVIIGGNVVSGWYIAGLGILTTLALLFLRSFV